jgi:glycerol-3-phosphate acyltransferase PlsY
MMPILLVLFGYFCGSVPFGLLLTRWFGGKDVRAEGSGNIGATNVARVAGKKVGAVVLLLDAVKGSLPVTLGLCSYPEQPSLHCAIGAAAFLGHVFPVWLRFQGGKGVATALGVLAVLVPPAALVGGVTWLVVVMLFKVSSVGSLLGGALAIVAAFSITGPPEYAWLVVSLFIAMLVTHRGNLKRLMRREEHEV